LVCDRGWLKTITVVLLLFVLMPDIVFLLLDWLICCWFFGKKQLKWWKKVKIKFMRWFDKIRDGFSEASGVWFNLCLIAKQRFMYAFQRSTFQPLFCLFQTDCSILFQRSTFQRVFNLFQTSVGFYISVTCSVTLYNISYR
jgi:hypothetical protein